MLKTIRETPADQNTAASNLGTPADQNTAASN